MLSSTGGLGCLFSDCIVQVSVGRLGIITKLVLAIVPNIQVRRSLDQMSTQQWIDQLKQVQDRYVQALGDNNMDAAAEALSELDETQVTLTQGDRNIFNVAAAS